MKAIHFSTTDYGGAYKAAERISEALRVCGVDSKVLVRTKANPESKCREILTNDIQRFWSKVKNVGNLVLSRGEIISDYFGTDVTEFKDIEDADVIFLHWVNSFISYRSVERILGLNKPVVWVMHDMWPFTGGCHLDGFCGGYQYGCRNCPKLKGKLWAGQIAPRNFERKARIFKKYSNISFVGPSKWLVSEAKKSLILENQEVQCIHNPIDTDIFKPYRSEAEIQTTREKYGLPEDKKLVLFGAMKAEKDTNKGFSVLIEALNQLDSEQYAAVIFGNRENISAEKLGLRMEVFALGMIKDEVELAHLYSAVDVMAVPSKQESFSYTVCEALNCGTPVVANATGGILDQIEHLTNGYLVNDLEPQAFAEGIEYCATRKMSSPIIQTDMKTIGEEHLGLLRNI